MAAASDSATLAIGAPIWDVPGIEASADDRRARCRLGAPVTLPDGTARTLWFEFAEQHRSLVDDGRCDAFVVALLPLAVTHGWRIRVDGALSARLALQLMESGLALLAQALPEGRMTDLTAIDCVGPTPGGPGVLGTFSGGIDSLCTIFLHRGERIPADRRVTHVLYNNVGSHGQSAQDRAIFRERLARLRHHAEQLGLVLIDVDSNLDEIDNYFFARVHSIRNVAVALLFQQGCHLFLYPSGLQYRDIRVRQLADSAELDPILLPLISTDRMQCLSSGVHLSRVAKTDIVARNHDQLPFLDVCIAPQRAGRAGLVNCSRCYKCLRTLCTLEVLGHLARYDGLFDLAAWRRRRGLYLCLVLSDSEDELLREIREALSEYDYPVPRSVRLATGILSAALTRELLETLKQAPSDRWRDLVRTFLRRGLRRRVR